MLTVLLRIQCSVLHVCHSQTPALCSVLPAYVWNGGSVDGMVKGLRSCLCSAAVEVVCSPPVLGGVPPAAQGQAVKQIACRVPYAAWGRTPGSLRPRPR